MKFDVFFTCEDPQGDPAKVYEEILAQIVRAEDLGFDGAWLAEHHGSTYGTAPEPAILLAAAARLTSRILLGPGVSILPFTNPIHTAAQYAMLDVLSNGRLRFGTGRGYQPREFDLFGLDPANSREVYQESVAVIRGLWENESFGFAGKHYAFDEISLNPRPLQSKVPFWVAAASPESFAAAATLDVQVFTQPSPRQTMDEMRDNMNRATAAFLERGYDEKDIDIPINVLVHVAETTELAHRQAQPALGWHYDKLKSLAPGADGRQIAKGYESYKSYNAPSGVTAASASERVSIDSLNQAGIAIIGDAEFARAALKDMQERFGLDHLSCFVRFGGLQHEHVMSSLEIWSTEVMPHFA